MANQARVYLVRERSGRIGERGGVLIEVEGGYRLTEAGLEFVRAVIAGAGIEAPTLEPSEVDASCTLCGAGVEVAYENGWVHVRCTECAGLWADGDGSDGQLVKFSLHPAGVEGRTPAEVYAAAWVTTFQKLYSMIEGVCPTCTGRVERALDVCGDHATDGQCPNCGRRSRIVGRLHCTVCKDWVQTTMGGVAKYHPRVVGFCYDHDRRRPSEFLDRATHRMVQGPYDVVIVVTDVPLVSKRERFVPGLASPLARVAVISTRHLRSGPRDQPRCSLDHEAVRWNAATLLVHLVGHVLGARHRDADRGVMEPFRFRPDRRAVPPIDADVETRLHRIAEEIPAAEARPRGILGRLTFHVRSAVRNPGRVLQALVNSRAPLLPLSLPKLSTAAVAPTLVIVFSAESWDVGFHMGNTTAGLFAVASVLLAAVYLLFAQNLTSPRERHRIVTEHTALVNVTVFLVFVLAMLSLFALVWVITLVIELVVFPPNLMSNWPSLEDPTVGFVDLVRTGAFISTIGVLSGALAGGLESRAIVSHLTLFLDRP